MHGKDRQGSIISKTEYKVEAPNINFNSALMNTFTQSKHAISTLDGHMMALMYDINSLYNLFHPHARNSLGMSDPNGTSAVFKFGDRTDLEQYLCNLYQVI